MTLSLDSAVQSLVASAEVHHERRSAERLAEVQALFADDLAWVEAALEQVVADGPGPGTDAARHLVSLGGKRVRPTALLLSAACFGELGPGVRELAIVAELIHSATLLHDDVVDEGTHRRGATAARRLWGNAVSVLGGDLLLVHALELTQQAAPGVLPSLIDTLRQLVDGEIVQLRGRTELDLSAATYERVLRGKSASLFRWSASTGARVVGADDADVERLARFGELLGMAFQLVDDVIDYASTESAKTPLADLREGKVTLPLVLAAERDPTILELVRAIHAGDDAPIVEVGAKVIASGACAAVRDRAAEHTARAIAVLGQIRPSRARDILEAVATQLAARRS